ncbi:hypothetical protein CEUSTIGMA_g2818.t1 [Chlamydomonas eustigma]|uniref:ABC1 atypical kinase-like domain-containing protein n=1 Tax=Chlamydomonas eustigma TaxID=1157962 RepID=A0A250WX14_9CHLO|nr:hypothetical protein CEUSTIGMA_g2818.t1 [Chlamydomonas eustigma]|eukprot:GAX75374.1 hypothetical protein CEUSTIGMA_g2818.t1 [Chlamydomonas eustigma]
MRRLAALIFDSSGSTNVLSLSKFTIGCGCASKSMKCKLESVSLPSNSGRTFAESARVGSCWMSLSPQMSQMLSLNRRALAAKIVEWELATAAVVCSVTDTRSGQRLLSSVLPLAVMVYLFPSRFHARAIAPQTYLPNRREHCLTKRQQTWVFNIYNGLRNVYQELGLWLRGLYLAALFSPAILAAPFVFCLGVGGATGRCLWMDLILYTIERAGPAFIKWAQWSSSRPDLFPADLCSRFERLQSGAPAHTACVTREAVSQAFWALERCNKDDITQEGDEASGRPLFESFEMQPVASGSIAQVHRATLSAHGAKLTGGKLGQLVAVKVRHPGVTDMMQRDFVLMQRAAWMCSLVPGLSELRLEESIRQFGGPLKEQLDLSVEARHLDRFNRNFRHWHHVTFPKPLYPLVTPSVLVETFEEGRLISHDVNQDAPAEPSKRRIILAETGLKLYLQMLLKDNFCHADLHPGNILVKEAAAPPFHSSHSTSLPSSMSSLLSQIGGPPKPHLVLLDAGMIAELNPKDQRNLVSFFRALTRREGEHIGRSILTLSEIHTCKDPDAFVSDMKKMFDSLDAETIRAHTAQVFKDMIETLRQHQVTLKSTVSTIVVTTLVLEGWSSKLDPDLHILDTMRDMIGMDLKERLGLTFEKICHAPAPSSLLAW